MGFAGNSTSKPKMRVLIYSNRDYDWTQPPIFLELRMNDIARLNKRRLNVS